MRSGPDRIDRRGFLGTLAVATVVSACGTGAPAGPGPGPTSGPPNVPLTVPPSPAGTATAARPRRSLLDVRFAEAHRSHPVELVAPGFVLVDLVVGDRVAGESREEVALPAPFVGIEVEVDDPGDATLVAGLTSADRRTGVHVALDPHRGEAELVLVVEGRASSLASERVSLPGAAFTLGFVLCENRATAFVRSGKGGWQVLVSGRSGIADRLDLRDPRTLATMGAHWGARWGACRVSRVRAGLFGMTGLRDPHLVQHADGRPYVEGGRHFVTWTCAGPGFFQQAHWGVFALDPADPAAMEQVAQIYTRRDGLLLGDHAGQLVRDGDRWLVANTSWGDFDGSGVHVRATTSTADLLHGVHVIETTPVALPTDLDTWDPSLTRIDGAWQWAYVESPSQSPFDFHPALARTGAADPFTALTAVASDRGRHQTEGTVLVRDTDRWLLLASDGDAREYPVYDLRLRRVGRLAAPYGSNIPHPQVLVGDDGRWLMVTFDGTNPFADRLGYGGHGDVVVLRER
ncbi:twin-arginine translocation signal domain-containing protein [Nocardioides kongjuensis]|uniref:Twin-arginine translocation signal domain-containing protein n=1 Tax=Nocardioides kongjuensis TaxID=349522 RepID=A0A852R7H1_9ACTN|nr:twin-arginine translocation signal domain-containing protein [Nocardioides kongjuensis]NYD30833.1 hypothetical protein [Nocardioides kongjuensis]